MKSSSGINTSNGGNSNENRKPTTASLSSSTSPTPKNKSAKKSTILIKPSRVDTNDRSRQEQQYSEFIQPATSFLINSSSTFESNHPSSNFKIELIPETIHHFNNIHVKSKHRPRSIKSSKSHAPPHTKNQNPSADSSIILVRSSIDLNSTIMSTSANNDSIHAPDMSITEMTDKDFNNHIHSKINNHEESTQTIATISTNHTIKKSENDKEKVYVSQGSQATIVEPKGRKIAHIKKIKSAPIRPKQPSATHLIQQSPQPTVPASPVRTVSQMDVNTTNVTKPVPVANKPDDSTSGKILITVDTSKARSNLEVVRMCLRELGWKECFNGASFDSDIFWHSSSFHEGNTTLPYTSGRVNKFPGMNDLLRKVHLTRSLNNMRALFPSDFDFYPKTWFLPEQIQQFKDDVRYIHQQDKKHNRSLTTFIIKPSDGSQGEGIYLLRDPAHCIATNRHHVAQEYIDRPLLINGLKFDLRIYVLILNLYPLEIFLYDEGLVRFATVGYKAPSTENLHQTYMHLTNYSLNKHSATYRHSTDNKQTDGSKRKLSLVWTQLANIFGNEKIERTKTLITEMINKTILAILPELRVEYEFEIPLGKKQNLSCFQIVGFDIILTDNLKPILLEVNANPSLRIDFDKENETGKLVYQVSPIDEEIKRPLVLETLKLALPKKKLNTFARHAQLQVNEELIAQRVEKLAQRRVEERSEKIKSARKTRFDLKSNPFFSRPSDTITKEFLRLQQEHDENQRVFITSPTHMPESPLSTNKWSPAASNSQSPVNIDGRTKITSPKIIRRTKKFIDSTDDDESGIPEARVTETNQYARNSLPQTPANSIRRPMIKSASNRSIMTVVDTTAGGPVRRLKMIFPLDYKIKYRHLFLIDKIAYIYIQLVIMLGHKTMTGGQFRSFATICGIMSDTITAPTIDILYYQILRKWQQFVLRSSAPGLPFPAFIEAFFLLSQRKFPTAQSLLDSVSQLVNSCIQNLNMCLQSPQSPLIQQSNQYLLHRASRMNNSNTQSPMNNRPTIAAFRSTTATATSRSLIVQPSVTAPKTTAVQIAPSATATTKTNGEGEKSKQSAKSVFPLFFSVL